MKSDPGKLHGVQIPKPRIMEHVRHGRCAKMSKVSRTPSRRPKATPSHRHQDVAGVILAAVAVVMGFALSMQDAGLIGRFLNDLFVTLFGRGAWAVPVLLLLIGGGLLARQSKLEVPRFAGGLVLIFLAIVGFLGGRVAGDLFDPERVLSNGGYVGAVVAWGIRSLLGEARLIGVLVLALVGLILCLDQPLRTLIDSLRIRKDQAEEPEPKRSPKRALIETSEEPKPDRMAGFREALVRLGDAVADGKPAPVEEPAAAPRPERRAPVIREAEIPKLDTQTPEPKEGYALPAMNLLNEPAAKQKRSPEEMKKNIGTLEGTLEQFGIDANVVEVATGPTITRYEIQLGPGIRVNRITNLADNIAMDLAASHVRVEAPIPGKAAIGVEVPNSQASMVTLREVVDNNDYWNHQSRLYVALGQDVSGVNRYCDLTRMPHMLIAGATNSGKSIGLATIITSLLLRNTPKDVRMVMIDPKRVELSLFDGIPHLMCPVVKDVKEAPGVLRAVWREMDNRYDRFSEVGVRNIDGWNEKASFAERLPYIVVIIDELADLMIQAAAEVETSIVRLAQLARAVGIHLVIATQRPSADVITGTIKANIPSRVAFAVAGSIDSRIILDQQGAERLVGKGDMLYMPIDASKPMRIQGCYVSEKEIAAVCEHWRKQERPNYVFDPGEFVGGDAEFGGPVSSGGEGGDELWDEAVQWVVERGQASTSMLQRRFRIGFQRASRLLDMMEEHGVVGPQDGPRPREVKVSLTEWEMRKRGQIADVPIDIDPLD